MLQNGTLNHIHGDDDEVVNFPNFRKIIRAGTAEGARSFQDYVDLHRAMSGSVKNAQFNLQHINVGPAVESPRPAEGKDINW